MISIIVPCYNEERNIEPFLFALSKVEKILKSEFDEDVEYVFVNDGSADTTLEVLKKNKVQYVSFSRNFGKEAAIMAGLNEVKGDCCVVIDCDLQHPPETIVEMCRLWKHGYQVVEGVKANRGKEGVFHKLFAKGFYSLISHSTGFDMKDASDFKLLDRRVIDVLKGLGEKDGFFRAMPSWAGFKHTTVKFEVQERTAGESKWSTKDLTRYAVRNITSYSTFPMQLVTALGAVTLAVSIIFGVISLVQKFMGVALEGFTTVIILLLFFSSIIMMSIGIVGYYISRIFEEVRNRPLYIISERSGDEG